MTLAVQSLLLSVLYVALVGSATAANWLVGAAAGAATAWALGLHRGARIGLLARRARFLPLFVGGAAWQLARGSWRTLRVLLGWIPWTRVGEVHVSVAPRSEQGAVVSSLVATTAPGTLVVEVDRTRGILVVNAIDASDPQVVRRDMQRFYERYQKGFSP